MNGEAGSSKSTGAKNSNPKNNKIENFSNGVIDNGRGRGRDRDRKEVNGAESLRVAKTESLICETLDHSSVQVEIDEQSEFDMDYSSSYQLSEVPVEYEQPPFSLTKKIKMADTRRVRVAAAAEPEPAEGVAARGRVRVRGVGQRGVATARGRARRAGRPARQTSPSPPPPDAAPAAEPEDEAEMEEEEVQVVEEEVPVQGNAAKDRISVTRPGTLNYRARTKHQRLVPDEASSLELSSTSVAQSISSVPSPTLAESRLSAVVNYSTGEVAKQSSDAKVLPLVPVLKTSACDGYNWRKYGQKQVKIPQGSRSYYRCTHFECCAKKIECSDHTNRVTEIIYRSQHNHDPPLRENCSRESKSAVLSAPTNGKSVIAHPNRYSNDTVASSLKENLPVAETAHQDSVGSDTDTEITIKEEQSDEPEQKKRSRKSDTSCSESVSEPGKKPKLVVHAACDVGISSDGYRWRKYGQKMVKGNPHPRNYYRCTSAGCPVRKHIERAVDSTSALTITYKGVHDHDMPVPKRRHGPSSAPLIATASPASLTNMRAKKPLSLQHQKSTTQWSVDKEGELTGEKLDLGGQKALESARTLLSIGFEIKPC